MSAWVKFLFGTPRRTIGTITVLLVLVAMVSPNTINNALQNLVKAVQPLVSLAVSIVILAALLKWAFKKVK